MGTETARNYREFLKDRKRQREEAAKLQQKGNDTRRQDARIAGMDRDTRKKNGNREEMSKHPDKNPEEMAVGKKEPEKEPDGERETHKRKTEALRSRRKGAVRKQLEHDMRDEALGQISGIPGANIDYDELNKMARNNIRDPGELVAESLQNDGLNTERAKDIEKAADIMCKYVRGEERIDAVRQLNENFSMDVIARAYMETARQSSVRDAGKLSQISDACMFEHPSYERVFDRLQAEDPETGRILDKLDMALGRERNRE